MAEYELSNRVDVRPLVLKTLLTYLELEGLLRQGTPFYAGYRMRPLGDAGFDELFARFDAERAAFLRRVVEAGKQGRVWTTLAPDDVAAALGEDRARIVSALGLPRGSGPRRAAARGSAPALRGARAPRRPRGARRRAAGPLRAPRATPRSHASRACSRSSRPTAARCRRSSPTSARCGPSRAATAATACPGPPRCRRRAPCPPPRRSSIRALLAGLRAEHAAALGQPRQLARFLCGLSSPATTRERLSRHELYGALAAHGFADVLALCDPA